MTDVDPTDGRDETANERSDRNWEDILQELRVTQTGTQIISGFLLTIVFQQRFAELSAAQTGLYLGLVVIAACCTILGLTPVGIHRRLFGRHLKGRTVMVADRLLRATIICVAALTCGVVFFVFDVVLGLGPAIIAAVFVAVVAVLLLGVLPRAESRSAHSTPR